MSEIWICGVCEKPYKLIHKPDGTHEFEEIPKENVDGNIVNLLIPELCIVKHNPKKKQLEEFMEK